MRKSKFYNWLIIAIGLIFVAVSKSLAQGESYNEFDLRVANIIASMDTCSPKTCYGTWLYNDTKMIFAALKAKFGKNILSDSCNPKSCFSWQSNDWKMIYSAIRGLKVSGGNDTGAWHKSGDNNLLLRRLGTTGLTGFEIITNNVRRIGMTSTGHVVMYAPFYDQNNIISIEPTLRRLSNSGGVTSVDYDNNILSVGSINTLDWGTGYLYSSLGNVNLKWQTDKLIYVPQVNSSVVVGSSSAIGNFSIQGLNDNAFVFGNDSATQKTAQIRYGTGLHFQTGVLEGGAQVGYINYEGGRNEFYFDMHRFLTSGGGEVVRITTNWMGVNTSTKKNVESFRVNGQAQFDDATFVANGSSYVGVVDASTLNPLIKIAGNQGSGSPYLQAYGNPLDINPLGNDVVLSNGSVKLGVRTSSPTSALQVVGLVEYTDNAAALAAGLTVGAFYRTGDLLKVVH